MSSFASHISPPSRIALAVNVFAGRHTTLGDGWNNLYWFETRHRRRLPEDGAGLHLLGRNHINNGFRRTRVDSSAYVNRTDLFAGQRGDTVDDGQLCNRGVADGPISLRRELVASKVEEAKTLSIADEHIHEVWREGQIVGRDGRGILGRILRLFVRMWITIFQLLFCFVEVFLAFGSLCDSGVCGRLRICVCRR